MEFQLRDVFNENEVRKFSERLKNAWPEFDRENFENDIISKMEPLSYGDRNKLICENLEKHLPDNFPKAVEILISALGPEPETEELSGYDGFIHMPQCLFVSRNGMKHFDESMRALYELTKRFTAEGDIRPFIEKYPEKTMSFLHELTKDPSPFARRLASEGTRPRLPLAAPLRQFKKDPKPVLEILEKLKNDPNEMVRRSVANNLNDIAKDNPDAVTDTLERWSEDKSPEMQKLIKHALRTLIKRGNPAALKLLGFSSRADVKIDKVIIEPGELQIGGEVHFSFDIISESDEMQELMIDYLITYKKANGGSYPKVFKWAQKSIMPGKTLRLKKKQVFTDFTTRKHYPGLHKFDIQINGNIFTGGEFILK